jgi:uncharacterized protein (TIGR02444 family)
MQASTEDSDNPLWQYSLAVYARPGVSERCLELQDHHGVDVNLLLSCCWLAEQGWHLEEKQARAMIQACNRWRQHCVLPLRALRRFLKDQASYEAFRQTIKAAELEAERLQQDKLWDLFSAGGLPQGQEAFAALAYNNIHQYAVCADIDWRALSSEVIALLPLIS